MNPFLTRIQEQILNSQLIEEEKQVLLKSIAEADKQWSIVDFKLDRTEKVKKTTAILLEETIDELEKKRQAVVAQNRELEIETALEKVRAVAMGMNKSDDLVEICEILFTEFRILGFDSLRNAMINIHDDEHASFVNYDYSDEIGKSITPLVYNIHPVIEKQIREIRSADDAFSETVFAGKDLEEWKQFRKERGEKDDPRIDDVIGLHYYFYSIGSGSIGISTFAPIDSEKLTLLKRFRNVFILAYQRYTDITKATAQAREAMIEAALERVRGRSMAMHKSSELAGVAVVLFQQLRQLGGNLWATGIGLCKKDQDIDEFWMATEGGMQDVMLISHIEDTVHRAMYEGWENGEGLVSIAKGGEDLRPHYDYMLTLPTVGPMFEAMIASGFDLPTWQTWHAAYFSSGYLLIITLEPYEEKYIFKRFAKVFEQAYTRFLDLQKAEAQAREAQIEAALERVRSRTMAMHKTDELLLAAELVSKELSALGITSMNVSYAFIDKDEKSASYYSVNPLDGKVLPFPFIFPHNQTEVMRSILSSWKKQEPFNLLTLDEDDTIKHQTWVGEHIQKLMTENGIPFFLEEFLDISPKTAVIYSFNFAQGYLFNIGEDRLTATQEDMVIRFTKVFEMTYRRFLDLQKAEAQAREAQIEAALERVRSRTMAMHNSEDVGNTVATLFDELVKLGVETLRCGIGILHTDEPMEVWTAKSNPNGEKALIIGRLDMTVHPLLQGIKSEWLNKQSSFSYVMVGEDLKNYYRAINNLPDYPIRFDIESLPPKQVHTDFFFPEGALFAFTSEPIPIEHSQIFKRFAGVFGQTYRRYLDLQKAEAQAREAQIETALERVRSRSMAMQKSDELKEVIQVVFEQFNHLSINIEHTGFVIDYKTRDDYYIWLADPLGTPSQVTISYFDSVYYNQFNEAKEKGDDFFATKLDFEEKNRFYQKLFEYVPGLSDEAKAFYFNCPGLAASTVLLDNIALYIENFSGIPYSEEENATLMRFGKVFQQTYTRFLDLQNAEEQAREGQIQLAMERVRARTMAMQKSDELTETASLLFEQVSALGIRTWTAGFNIWSEDNNSYVDYISSPTGGFIEPYTVYTDAAEALIDIRNARKSGVEFDVLYVEGEKIRQLYMALTRLDEKAFDIMLKDGGQFPSHQYEHFAFGSKISLMFITYEPVPEAHDIFKRFGKVFEQTYTRFLDLQKAEAQAREAKVEASLEKVRSRTMAMQRSSELADVATVLFQQVKALGIPQWTCGFNIWEIGDKEFTFYPGSPDGDILPSCKVPLTEDPTFMSFDESRRRGDELFVYEKTGERQREHYKYMLALPGGLGDFLQNLLDAGVTFPDFQIDHIANFSHGNLLFITYEHFPEMHDIFKRFAKVFDQTYTRFLDLQKAEAQAREAQIEATLEKVRSRTMAMQHSDELGDAALLLFQQVKLLGGKLFGCGFNIWDEDKKTATAWMAGDDRIQPPFKTSSSDDVFQRIFDAEQKGERLFVEEMRGEENQMHYRYMLSIPEFKKIVDHFKFSIPEFQIMHCAFFSQGYLMFISFEPVPEAHDLFMRLAKVFEQTYTRFLDLKKAEALAKEALKQASLDRIRGQVASMRSSDDLDNIIPLLWFELGSLGVPFIRCGVFIMNEADAIVNVYLSSPDGKSLGLLHLPFNTGGVTENAVAHWRKKKVFKEHWNKEEFIAWTQNLIAAGQVHDSATYQGSSAPPESLHLNFVPFKQGMLYVGSAEALNHEIIELLKTLASTFSIAYSRYEDFRLLENAKNRIETTLVELKATQSQLVQSEKMASLGELTAGIAHEIQNPLNFVNNFSEVNTELFAELEEELRQGHMGDAEEIIKALRENELKINQHGKRADAIVKGMLLHSRTSTGEKESTDINALADEYLRLAYHGFRAKDKSFNAILETDLDPSIGKIKAVPQELGRVLLNLYNNAFYAVNEKAGEQGYDPKVRLCTTKHGQSIMIAVQDNGKGIPEKVKEKIFQPFFTTKPTGQGTGLGLSLSYDIVKAHGGEFRVDSKEGEGTSFVIQLPV